MGIIEFGYLFGEYNEVRHSAREGARIAAVSNEDFDQDGDSDFDEADIAAYACSVLNMSGSTATVTLTQGGTDIGDTATITVNLSTTSLSGAPLISSFIPANLSNTATFVLEQPASWSVPGTAATC